MPTLPLHPAIVHIPLGTAFVAPLVATPAPAAAPGILVEDRG